MRRVLVLGEPGFRETLIARLEAVTGAEVVECDPALGDCVMYVRLEGARYDVFFFAGFDHAVTRGALAVVADRAVLIPLLEEDAPPPDASHDGYLFRLPQVLGFRDEAEKGARVLTLVPKASTVPAVLVGRRTLDPNARARSIELASRGAWHWDCFVEGVRQDVEHAR